MKTIPITQNRIMFVDDDVFKKTNRYKWHYTSTGYAARRLSVKEGGKIIYLHRQIMNTPKGMDTDHIDHNKLNNQKSNLRICTRSQNCQNNNKHKDNKSGFKGVSLHKCGKWVAQIYSPKDNQINYIGLFSSKKDAVQAYNDASIKLFGRFANPTIEQIEKENKK